MKKKMNRQNYFFYKNVKLLPLIKEKHGNIILHKLLTIKKENQTEI